MIGCAAVVAAWLRFAASQRPELLVSAIGGVAGFTYFLYRQHLDEAKLFKDLFADFNARYGTLNDGLNAILFGARDGSLSTDERKLLFSYFNLCAEEYYPRIRSIATSMAPNTDGVCWTRPAPVGTGSPTG